MHLIVSVLEVKYLRLMGSVPSVAMTTCYDIQKHSREMFDWRGFLLHHVCKEM